MQIKKFPVLVEKDEDDVFIVSCPSFKGCHSYGYTIDEAMNNIQEAIELCIEETNEEELNKYVEIRELNLPVNV